jgi:hypothetical protein
MERIESCFGQVQQLELFTRHKNEGTVYFNLIAKINGAMHHWHYPDRLEEIDTNFQRWIIFPSVPNVGINRCSARVCMAQ